MERFVPRPNPIVDGRRYATIAREARVNMASDGRDILAQTARLLRAQAEQERMTAGRPNDVGRPNTDVYDLAVMAVLRIADGFSYEGAQNEIEQVGLLVVT